MTGTYHNGLVREPGSKETNLFLVSHGVSVELSFASSLSRESSLYL
jgi:hypothetical protein